MSGRPKPETVQVIKKRRDGAVTALVSGVPSILPFSEKLIGNPIIKAIHGGATASFLEVTSIITLSWSYLWEDLESGALDVDKMDSEHMPRLPKTIDFTVDYLRSGLPRDAYARATINRSGRRYASVHVEAWQDNRAKLFAQATGHFLMPHNRG